MVWSNLVYEEGSELKIRNLVLGSFLVTLGYMEVVLEKPTKKLRKVLNIIKVCIWERDRSDNLKFG